MTSYKLTHLTWHKVMWWVVLTGILGALYLLFLRFWVDPRPVGVLQDTLSMSFQAQIAAQAEMTRWVATVPVDTYSVQLTAAYSAGEQDSLYGIVLGSPATPFTVAVSPLGYAAVTAGPATSLVAFAPFPHVHTYTRPNELWIDVYANEIVRIRINREVLWEGQHTLEGDQVSVFGRSFGETTHIDYERLLIFYEPPS